MLVFSVFVLLQLISREERQVGEQPFNSRDFMQYNHENTKKPYISGLNKEKAMTTNRSTAPNKAHKNTQTTLTGKCPTPSEQIAFRQFLKAHLDVVNINKIMEVSGAKQLKNFIYRDTAFTDYEQWVSVKYAFAKLFSKMGEAAKEWKQIKNTLK